MPPAGRPRPDRDTYVRFASWLETELDAASAAAPNPGRPVFHRLNRVQYGNAVRDLLGIDAAHAAELVPPNASTHGFDNVAAVLGVDPTLIERYLSAARKLSALAVGDPDVRPPPATYRAPIDLTQNEHLDGMPFGTRGGHARAPPLSGRRGVRTSRAKLGRNVHELIRGLNDHHDGRVQPGRRAARGCSPSAGSAPGTGERAGLRQPPPRRLPDGGLRGAGACDGRPARGHRRRFLKTSAAQLEDRPPTLVGVPLQGPALRQPFQSRPTCTTSRTACPTSSRLDIEGPHERDRTRRHREPPAHLHLPTRTRPADEPVLRPPRLRPSLAGRAWRRPVDGGGRGRAAAVLRARSGGRGGGFEAGIRMVVRALLVSREFLFRVEAGAGRRLAPGTPYRIGAGRAGVAPVVLPVEQHPGRRAAGARGGRHAAGARPSWSARCAACWRTAAPGRWSRTSRASGCTCATCSSPSRIRSRIRTSTTTSGRRCGARRSCCSRPSCARTATSPSCSRPTTRSSTSGWRATTAFPACTAATSGACSSRTRRAAA